MDSDSEGAALTSESEASIPSESSGSSSSSLPVLDDDKASSFGSKSPEAGEDYHSDEDIPGVLEEFADFDSDNAVDKHDTVCKICKDGGDVICCDTCTHVYHKQCLNPPLSVLPRGDWLCPRCSCYPIKGRVRSIVTWRWDPEETEEYKKKYFKSSVEKRKFMALPRREFFVHLYEKSYWHCIWVKTIQMQVYHPGMLRPEKQNTPEPPQPFGEDDEDYDEIQAGIKNGLKERFYDNGVRPDWLKVQRVVNQKVDANGAKLYLVKWVGLSYEYATFENEASCSDPLLLPEFKRQVEIYKEFRNYFLPQEKRSRHFVYKHIKVGPSKSCVSLKEQYKADQVLTFLDQFSGLVLHEYQIEGLNWLRYNWSDCIDSILADEMGLGKTIQAVTFLYSLYKEGHCEGPFLLSVPLSTVPNWERELAKWAPDFYVVTYTGDKDCRQIIRQHELTYESKGQLAARDGVHPVQGRLKFHVLLTSFEFVSMDATCLQSIDWAIMIIDEAHRLKSGSSKFFISMANYKADWRLLLTGTPLQNKLEELYYLLHFLCPKKFSSLDDFLNEFTDISKEDQIKQLQRLLGPHMLRRLKTDVLKNMPSKSEFIVRVEMTPLQKEYYKHVLTRNFDALNSKSGGKIASLATIFVELKKCCNHPYLFSKAMMEAPVINKGQVNERYELEALTAGSGKLLLMRKMLEKLKEQGHRVLIFSQMTRLLDILEDFLHGLEYQYERIDGTVKGGTRQASIDRFNDPKSKSFVFLLSTKAGGLGINLATADTVIIYDSDWNPHSDIQALSRAHRIGQKNKVLIYRFVTRNTVEQRVMEVCKKKMLLTQLVVESSRQGAKGDQVSFSKQEFEQILRFGAENLFKEDKEDDKAAIHYTDEAIDKLLDRNQESSEETEEEKGGINEYLQSFKVAQYSTNVHSTEEDNQDPDFWNNLLNKDGILQQQQQQQQNDLEVEELMEEDEDLSLEERVKIGYRFSGRRKRKAAMNAQYKAVGKPPPAPKVGSDEYDDEYQPPQPKILKTGTGKRGRPPKGQSVKQPKQSKSNASPSKTNSKGQMANGQSSSRGRKNSSQPSSRGSRGGGQPSSRGSRGGGQPSSRGSRGGGRGGRTNGYSSKHTASPPKIKSPKPGPSTSSPYFSSSNRPNKPPDEYYSEKMYLSPELSNLLGGKRRMSRNMIRRHITLDIVETEDLYDKNDPHADWVICNDDLYAVFQVNRFKISEMFKKYLDQHLYANETDEEEDAN